MRSMRKGFELPFRSKKAVLIRPARNGLVHSSSASLVFRQPLLWRLLFPLSKVVLALNQISSNS